MATASGKAPGTGDVFIDASEMRSTPRGRKAIIDHELVETFRQLPAGKGVRLASKFGKVAKAEKAKVSARIRTAWKVAHPGTACSITYTPEGIPQVFRKG